MYSIHHFYLSHLFFVCGSEKNFAIWILTTQKFFVGANWYLKKTNKGAVSMENKNLRKWLHTLGEPDAIPFKTNHFSEGSYL